MQQEFVAEQLNRYCAARRPCPRCSVIRKLHDSHCSEVCTAIGRALYIRERWKACSCGADDGRYISPLKNYLRETNTAELKWLHAKLGAMLPYRQALEILAFLLPSSGRDSHVTLRNHTIAVGQAVQSSTLPVNGAHSPEPIAELGIDVGYVRKTKSRPTPSDGKRETGAISIVVAAVGPRGKRPSTGGGLVREQTAWCRSVSRYRTKSSMRFLVSTSDGQVAGASRGPGCRLPTPFNGFPRELRTNP